MRHAHENPRATRLPPPATPSSTPQQSRTSAAGKRKNRDLATRARPHSRSVPRQLDPSMRANDSGQMIWCPRLHDQKRIEAREFNPASTRKKQLEARNSQPASTRKSSPRRGIHTGSQHNLLPGAFSRIGFQHNLLHGSFLAHRPPAQFAAGRFLALRPPAQFAAGSFLAHRPPAQFAAGRFLAHRPPAQFAAGSFLAHRPPAQKQRCLSAPQSAHFGHGLGIETAAKCAKPSAH